MKLFRRKSSGDVKASKSKGMSARAAPPDTAAAAPPEPAVAEPPPATQEEESEDMDQVAAQVRADAAERLARANERQSQKAEPLVPQQGAVQVFGLNMGVGFMGLLQGLLCNFCIPVKD